MSKKALTPEQKAAITRQKMWHDDYYRCDHLCDLWSGPPCDDPLGPTDQMARELGLPPIPRKPNK
jgi:hypothetical protein